VRPRGAHGGKRIGGGQDAVFLRLALPSIATVITRPVEPLMMLSGDRGDMQRQLRAIVSGYEDFQDFDDRELWLIEALRTLRLIHYSAWLARRWDDPAFPAAFPWFNTQRYWQDRILELREQVAAMDEPALVM